jgi:hypothetical protein
VRVRLPSAVGSNLPHGATQTPRPH